jgi:hypothetical protein
MPLEVAMAYKSHISPEIEANPDWAAAVRRADRWVADYYKNNPADQAVAWSVRPGPAGGPVFVLNLAVAGIDAEHELTPADLDDERDFWWRLNGVWRQAIDRAIRAEFAGIKRLLKEWSEELHVAAEN